MLVVKVMREDGTEAGALIANPKTFSTGSKGFHASGKIEINKKRYQCNFMLIEIGSKPAPAVNFTSFENK